MQRSAEQGQEQRQAEERDKEHGQHTSLPLRARQVSEPHCFQITDDRHLPSVSPFTKQFYITIIVLTNLCDHVTHKQRCSEKASRGTLDYSELFPNSDKNHITLKKFVLKYKNKVWVLLRKTLAIQKQC